MNPPPWTTALRRARTRQHECHHRRIARAHRIRRTRGRKSDERRGRRVLLLRRGDSLDARDRHALRVRHHVEHHHARGEPVITSQLYRAALEVCEYLVALDPPRESPEGKLLLLLA